MYLLDTHALLWAVGAPDRLSLAAREAVESRMIKVSVVSLWELIIKKNRLAAPVTDPPSWWERHIIQAAVEVVAIRVPHLMALARLPDLHQDPFDRMLIAQARAEQLRIVSADRAFSVYPVELVW